MKSKSAHEDIDYYRLYATDEAEKIARDMRDVEDDILEEARRVFTSADAVQALILGIEAGMPESKLLDRLNSLEAMPRQFGKVSGHWLRPDERAGAVARLPYLADRLRDFADLARARQGYEALHQRALEAFRLPPSRQAEALEALRHERDFADTVRDTREDDREHRRERYF